MEKSLEAMRCTSFREKHIVDAEAMPVTAIDKPAAAAGDDVDFVARMRRLGIDAARRVKLDLQRAVLEQRD